MINVANTTFVVDNGNICFGDTLGVRMTASREAAAVLAKVFKAFAETGEINTPVDKNERWVLAMPDPLTTLGEQKRPLFFSTEQDAANAMVLADVVLAAVKVL